MITVNCSQCKAVLEMDDAFAGGVSRCHYCGTIQAVPANARKKETAPVPVAAGAGHAGGTGGRGDGLDALADVVAGSGLGRATLQSSRPGGSPAAQPVDYARPPRQKGMPLPLIVALGVIVLLLFVVGYLVVGTSGTTVVTRVGPNPPPLVIPPVNPNAGPSDSGRSGGDDEPGPPVAIPRTPHFCGISLEGVPSVAYVLDRGNATAELLDRLKETTYRSLESLKPGQRFQIVFWDNSDDPAAYPTDGLVAASPEEIEAARARFADVLASGKARADAAVQRAAKSQPAVIIIVSGNAFDLENSLADAVLAATKGTTTKVHTVALRSDDGNPVLKHVAGKTHGEFRVISAKELLDYSY